MKIICNILSTMDEFVLPLVIFVTWFLLCTIAFVKTIIMHRVLSNHQKSGNMLAIQATVVGFEDREELINGDTVNNCYLVLEYADMGQIKRGSYQIRKKDRNRYNLNDTVDILFDPITDMIYPINYNKKLAASTIVLGLFLFVIPLIMVFLYYI